RASVGARRVERRLHAPRRALPDARRLVPSCGELHLRRRDRSHRRPANARVAPRAPLERMLGVRRRKRRDSLRRRSPDRHRAAVIPRGRSRPMRIARLEVGDRTSWARLVDDTTALRWTTAPWAGGSETDERVDLSESTLLVPVTPSKIVCVGRNYRAHAAELGH